MKHLIWRVVHALVFVVILTGTFVSLTTGPWLTQGKEDTHWKGTLLSPMEGNVYSEEKNYYELSKDYQGGAQDMFENLYIGGVMYITLASLGCLFLILTIVFLVFQKYTQAKSMLNAVIASWAGFLLLVFAYFSWATLAKVEFGECQDLSEKTQEPVCAHAGSVLALVLICVYFVSLLMNCWLWRSVKTNEAGQQTRV